MDERIKKMRCIYTTEYYSDVKENEILSFAKAGMDLEGIMLSDISQRKPNAISCLLYMASKQNK